MGITRRSLLTSLFALPLIGGAFAPRRSEALEWVLSQLEPGRLIVVQASNTRDVRDLIEEVMRVKGNQLVYPSMSVRSPRDLKREALRRNLPTICGASTHAVDAFRMADVVVYIDWGQMRVTKHRLESCDRPPMAMA